MFCKYFVLFIFDLSTCSPFYLLNFLPFYLFVCILCNYFWPLDLSTFFFVFCIIIFDLLTFRPFHMLNFWPFELFLYLTSKFMRSNKERGQKVKNWACEKVERSRGKKKRSKSYTSRTPRLLATDDTFLTNMQRKYFTLNFCAVRIGILNFWTRFSKKNFTFFLKIFDPSNFNG